MAFAPSPGEFRLTMPGASRSIVVKLERTRAGHTLIRRAGRAGGLLTPSGHYEGRPWAREALAALAAGRGEPVVRCGVCARELTDQDSKARGVGPDCWAARSRSA